MHEDRDEDDDDTTYDFPYRPLHPWREAFTMTVAALVIVWVVGWCVWKLTQ